MRKDKILIVDDDLMMHEIYLNVLRERQYNKIVQAINGVECYDEVMGANPPGIILLDHHLDILDGLTVLKRIKSARPEIHVIYISGQQDVNVAISSLKLGADDYLIKDDRLITNLNHTLSAIEKYNEAGKKGISLPRELRWLNPKNAFRQLPKYNLRFQNETQLGSR
jgi:polysaccharide export outer membrane protein